MRTAPPRIEVLSLPGCPNALETLRMAEQVAGSMVPGTEARDVRVSEPEARKRGFPGSPTVLVNGRDFEGREPHAAGAA